MRIPLILAIIFLSNGGMLLAQKTDKLYETAQQLFYKENFTEAQPYYEEIITREANFKDADYKLELCRLLTSNGNLSLEKILEFGQTKGKSDKFYPYWLGRVYALNYEFENAVKQWQKFLDSHSAKSNEIKKETTYFIKDAQAKIDFFNNTDEYEIHQLESPINSEFAELAPAYSAETKELLFASSRGSNNSKEVFKIYHAVEQNNKWQDIREIKILGTFTRETASIEIVNEDGKLFLFNPAKGGNLFYSTNRNNNWMAPVEFDAKVTSAHLKSHFFINSHEDRVIFATDANYKSHKLDLYQTFKDPKSGKWTKPAPFADIINSTENEDSPSLSPDENTLYFSSNGHGSIGGYDIFKTTFDSKTATWSEPENLGFPINSPGDEIQFRMNKDGKSGYFSSNRLHSKGDYDIYFFWEIEKISIEGRIYDSRSGSLVLNGSIRFTPSQYADEHFKSFTNEKGRYSTKIIANETYLVEIFRNDTLIHTEEFVTDKTDGSETLYFKDFIIPSSDLTLAKSTESKKIKNSDVSDATTSKNIITNSSNNTIKPVPENLTDKKLSTELKKETTPKNSQEVKKIEKPMAVVTTQNDVKNFATYSTGSKVIINNIYFDFGTSRLNSNSNTILNELLEVLLKNPSIYVEISGHTDNLGSADANMWMSQRRAENVMKWLIQQGVAPHRLTAKGYGEERPLASNDDEENGRELNRRIEVLKIQ